MMSTLGCATIEDEPIAQRLFENLSNSHCVLVDESNQYIIDSTWVSYDNQYLASLRVKSNLWSRRESNPYQTFRKRLFYPLNYGTKKGAAILTARFLLQN